MKRFLTLILALSIVVAACGADESGDATTSTTSSDGTTTTTSATFDADQRILEVRYEGGFVPVEFLYSQPPQYTLYGDGRLVYPAPIPEIFPGPLMQDLVIVDIGVDGLNDVLAAVRAAGLPDVTEIVNDDAAQFVADASNTVITYTDENGDHVYNVYALGITDEFPELNNLLRLVQVLDELAATSPTVGEYPVERIQVLVSEAFNSSDPQATVVPWPLTTDPADVPDFVVELKCTVLEGDEAAEALSVFRDANQMTFFESAGTDYRLTVRPLLDGETGCDAPA